MSQGTLETCGLGKRAGARVIYFNRLNEQKIWLLTLYVKAVRGSIPAHAESHCGGIMSTMEKAMTGHELGEELLAAVKQMTAGKAARETPVELTQAAQARANVGLSQNRFAELLDVSTRTLQDREQGRRQATVAARTLLAWQ